MVERRRSSRVEFRTDPATRRLIELAAEESGTTLTEFAEQNLTAAAERLLADRDRFVLTADAAAEWDALTSRPARDLPSVRALMARPSPFATPAVADTHER